MDTIIEFVVEFFNFWIFIYALTIALAYLVLAIISARELQFYRKSASFIDYNSILGSKLAPSLSIIAPCYNEEKSIVESVRSFLGLHYNNYEVIVVNDGSKDRSLQVLIEAYDMVKVDYFIDEKLRTNPIRGVYKSRNLTYSKLILIDKVNGGKGDALNAGVNVSAKRLVICVDADCILAQDSLLKMVRPYMNEKDRIIATGSVVRIANDCDFEYGRLVRVNLPKKFIPRIQVLEYLRAFLMGRMAWSRLNGLLIVSGALGLFDKEIMIKSGGYDTTIVGEDMELVVRMRRWCHDHGLRYRIVYIPEPLCWTEAPTSLNVLGRQRNRWTRGSGETLWIHRGLMFNPRYGMLGFISYPFWLFFEWFAPFVETIGMLYFALMIALGLVNWVFFFSLLAMIYVYAVLLSFAVIMYEELTYRQYRKRSDIVKLLITAMIEPIVFHPMVTYWAIKGNFDLLRGQKRWGDMARKGFEATKAKDPRTEIII